jgi:serine/threonine-protein kinase HipA
MNRIIEVFVALAGQPRYVGKLWSRVKGSRESASFRYDEDWLRSPERFALEPLLTLDPGTHHTPMDRSVFGAIGDSAPDRWGRILMTRFENKLAEEEQRTPRTLLEIDYLLMVNDTVRQGALRFRDEQGHAFLASAPGTASIPPLVDLPRLMGATDNVLNDTETAEDLKLLLAPGSSLGGARPKSAVLDRDGRLLIAKFPRKDDDHQVEGWSHLAMNLAHRGGISTAGSRLATIADRKVHLLERFDRDHDRRIPYLSAMSMLGAKDKEFRSYLEIADAIRQHGINVNGDLEELWRRILFSVLICNTDDHLRNHGFLYDIDRRGWRISPAFDLNPMIDTPRYLSVAINEQDSQLSFDLVLSVGDYFGLDAAARRRIVGEVFAAVSGWRREADRLGIARAEIDRMAGAFQHEAHADAQRYVA